MSPSLLSSFEQIALSRPNDVAVRFLAAGEGEAEPVTYLELREAALARANGLRRRGLPGTRALLAFPSGLPFISTMLGCMYAGVIPAPVAPPRAREDSGWDHIERIARDCSARTIICPDSVWEARRMRLDRRPSLPDAGPEWVNEASLTSPAPLSAATPASAGDIAFLQYTSGSTAQPRGVVVTHAALTANIAATTAAMSIDKDSVFLSWLPLHHDMGLIGMLLQALHGGNQLVLMSPQHFLQRPLRWLEAISRFRATLSGGPNFAYDLCVRRSTPASRAELDLSSWTIAFNGAEPVKRATMDAFAEAFAPSGFARQAFFPCYGLAETTLYATGGRGLRARRFDPDALSKGRARICAAAAGVDVVSCGASPDGHEVVVVHPQSRRRLAEGEVGEILLRGPSVAGGYWSDPDASRDIFAVRVPGVGDVFLATGDLGFLWEGELFVTGRLKDMMLMRGRNIYPQDIELTAEGCDPAAPLNGCVAFPETVAGEERLVIVKEVRHERADVLAALAPQIARRVAADHEIHPYRVVLTKFGAIPKTTSGKVRRGASRAALAAGALPILADHRSPLIHPQLAGHS